MINKGMHYLKIQPKWKRPDFWDAPLLILKHWTTFVTCFSNECSLWSSTPRSLAAGLTSVAYRAGTVTGNFGFEYQICHWKPNMNIKRKLCHWNICIYKKNVGLPLKQVLLKNKTQPLKFLIFFWCIHVFFSTNLLMVVFIQQSLSTDGKLLDSWKFVGRQTDCKTICHTGPGGSPFTFRHSGPVFAPLTGLSELFVTALFSDQIGCTLCGLFFPLSTTNGASSTFCS